MNLENLNSLEDRIQKPGYLLFLVTVFLFLIIGFVNLIDYTSREPAVFSRYSYPYLGLLVLYAVILVLWFTLLLKPNNDRLLKRTLDFLQKRPLLALALLVAYAGVAWSLLRFPEWLNFPALQTTIIFLILLSSSLLLFYRWGDSDRPQSWRKLVLYPLLLFIAVELLVQLATVAGIAPNLNSTTDSFAPFSRIYYAEEGARNGFANSDGWNYPPFKLYPDSHRILLFGDSYIQALQVAPEEHMGIILEQLLGADLPAGEFIEVLAIGNPDYGPGLYLNVPMIDYAIEAYQPDEVITFFDVGNDFQNITAPNPVELYFIINDAGEVEIHEDNFWLRHQYQHEVLHAYEGFQPNRFLRSVYLTPQIVQYYLRGETVNAHETAAAPESKPYTAVFNAETNDEMIAIATGHIQLAYDHLSTQGIDFRLVTIPALTAPFYEQDEWNTRFDDEDLLLPEQELRDFARVNGIPFLSLGSYLAAESSAPENVQPYFLKDGMGHFSPTGHEMVADAVYQCFYSQSVSADSGCDAP